MKKGVTKGMAILHSPYGTWSQKTGIPILRQSLAQVVLSVLIFLP